MKARLEIAVNVTVILAVVVLGGLMAHDRLLVYQATHSTGDLKPGVRLDPPATYDWSKHPSTLLLALRRDCHYCEQSIPFYQRLAMREREQRLSAHLVAVISSGGSNDPEYAASRNLSFEFFSNADFAKLKIRGTPTLILVDQTGRVSRVWVGKLTDAQEMDVLRAAGG